MKVKGILILFIILSTMNVIGEEDKKLIDIQSSSTLTSKTPYKYSELNLLDGDPHTAWVEGIDGDGIGEYVVLSLGSGKELKNSKRLTIEISNGYQKNDNVYQNNGIPTKVRIELLYGSKIIQAKEISLPVAKVPIVPSDNGGKVSCTYGVVFFKNLPETSEDIILKITILDVKKGKKWDDTAISEIKTEFLNANPHNVKKYLEEICKELFQKDRPESSENKNDIGKLKKGRGFDPYRGEYNCEEYLSSKQNFYFVRSETVVDAFYDNDCDGEDGWFQRFIWNGTNWHYLGFVQYRTCDGC